MAAHFLFLAPAFGALALFLVLHVVFWQFIPQPRKGTLALAATAFAAYLVSGVADRLWAGYYLKLGFWQVEVNKRVKDVQVHIDHLDKIIKKLVSGGFLRIVTVPLQILQTAEHMVVFIVGDLRIVQHVVAVAVGVEGVPQFLHLGFIVHVSLILCS